MPTEPKAHHIDVRPSGGSGIHTGRPRYRVACWTCGVVLRAALDYSGAEAQRSTQDTPKARSDAGSPRPSATADD